jgi:hypothetical protein
MAAATDPPSLLDWIVAGAQAITALSVIFLFWQVWQARKNSQAERTRHFQERYQSDEFSISVIQLLSCLDVENAGQCIDLIKAWSNRGNARKKVLPQPKRRTKSSVYDIEKILGLFEDMGTAYNLKQLEKKFIERSFAMPTVQIFTTAWWLICWQRKGRLGREKENGRVEEVYVEFEGMCRSLRKGKASLRRDPELQPPPAIRTLCLPKGHGEKLEDDSAWEDSRRLSLALSALVGSAEGKVAKRLAELARSIATVDGPAPDPQGKWEVILVPSIDQRGGKDWANQRAATKELANSLNRLATSEALDLAIGHIEERAGPSPARSPA